jgi:antitoxin (DNA-binding transcriptional repressor) of toxin-antitoxin stability system
MQRNMSHRHSSRRLTSTGGFGRTHVGADDDLSDTEQSGDLDIDFNITDSGRTVAHLIAHLKEDDNMDFSIANSGRLLDQFDNADTAAGKRERTEKMDCDGLAQEDDLKKGGIHAHSTRSKAKPIPIQSNVPSRSAGAPSQANSQESSGSSFFTAVMNTKLAHTPPVAASYEMRHFGKRPRAGVCIFT